MFRFSWVQNGLILRYGTWFDVAVKSFVIRGLLWTVVVRVKCPPSYHYWQRNQFIQNEIIRTIGYFRTVPLIVWYNTKQYKTKQYKTIQYNTIQYKQNNTKQNKTIQYKNNHQYLKRSISLNQTMKQHHTHTTNKESYKAKLGSNYSYLNCRWRGFLYKINNI